MKLAFHLRRLVLSLYGYIIFRKRVRVHGFFKVLNAANVQIGKNVSINHGVFIQGRNRIILGDNVTLSPYCMLFDSGLDIEDIHGKQVPVRHVDSTITIENGVWIGGGAIVLPGVSIGANSIVGAGSVVTRSVPPSVIIAGNPARIIREMVDHDG
jgi:acetyltransferase-like isoleucine patch superfamily enzyme